MTGLANVGKESTPFTERFNTMTFGEELKQWRSREALTQKQAADYLRVNVRLLQDWEQDRQEPGAPGPVRALMELFIHRREGHRERGVV